VSWKDSVNRALSRTTGYELRQVRGQAKAAAHPRARKVRRGDRLLEQPGFVMCTLRSGSTLLRVMLDSHSQIHCPHEIHLRYLSVNLEAKWVERSMREMGLDQEKLEYLLWDRVLHRQLSGSGKQRLVTKTPNDVFIADRIKTCWPDAKLIFLLRHPAAIVRSRKNLQPDDADQEKNVDLIRRYCEALERARQTYDGVTIRYEDLTADPAATTQKVCEHLGVAWEPGMLEYGSQDHGRYKSGLGDWQEKIKSGKVQAAEPPPDELPEPLRAIAATWGYTRQPAELETPRTS
jgi:Sulfotransferase family